MFVFCPQPTASDVICTKLAVLVAGGQCSSTRARTVQKALTQQRLTIVSGQAADPVQVIGTLPLPVCGYTHSRRDHCFKACADYGHCAAKKLDY